MSDKIAEYITRLSRASNLCSQPSIQQIALAVLTLPSIRGLTHVVLDTSIPLAVSSEPLPLERLVDGERARSDLRALERRRPRIYPLVLQLLTSLSTAHLERYKHIALTEDALYLNWPLKLAVHVMIYEDEDPNAPHNRTAMPKVKAHVSEDDYPLFMLMPFVGKRAGQTLFRNSVEEVMGDITATLS